MIKTFTERLARIGVNLTYIGNFPWVYLNTVNGEKVQGTFQANHGFTAFTIVNNNEYKLTDRRVIFKKIRSML